MTFDFVFEPANRLCVYRISGQISADALMRGFVAARAHPDWSDDFNFLSLLKNASLASMPAEAMADLQARMAAAAPVPDGPRRRAAIVCDDHLAKAILTYWEMIADKGLATDERVFETEDAARAWLAEA